MDQDGSTPPRASDTGGPAAPPPSRSGMGLGMRMATDMVVATLIGVGMGYYLDEWLGLHPWMTVLFFLFGAVAGFRAVYRAAQEDSPQAP
ncbi:MAG: AtpZ/AtpI family protein [Magnetococcus sp. XQGC-1]